MPCALCRGIPEGVQECYGEGGTKAVESKVALCAGIAMGGWDAALAYASKMAEHIQRNKACSAEVRPFFSSVLISWGIWVGVWDAALAYASEMAGQLLREGDS